MLSWKTQSGKNHGSPLTANYHYDNVTTLGTEATTTCSLASPTGSYNRGNNLFLSLSLCTVALDYRPNYNDLTS